MTCSVLLDNLQPQHLVAGNGEVGQCEYRVLVPPLPSRLPVVAYAEYFERRLLLHLRFASCLSATTKRRASTSKEMFVPFEIQV